MSDQDSKATRKAFKPVLTRLDKNEADIAHILVGVQQGFTAIDGKVRTLQEIADAIVSVIGLDKVQKAIDDARIAELQKESEMELQGLEMAKSKGMLEVGEIIGERSVIVGHENDPEGYVLPPGRAQLLFAQVKEELRGDFVGKKVGDSVPTLVGGQFIIDEIWNVVAKEVNPPADEAAALAVDTAFNGDINTELELDGQPIVNA